MDCLWHEYAWLALGGRLKRSYSINHGPFGLDPENLKSTRPRLALGGGLKGDTAYTHGISGLRLKDRRTAFDGSPGVAFSTLFESKLMACLPRQPERKFP
jgi:hypothetical protein